MIDEYKLVMNANPKEFERLINEGIRDGFVLYGELMLIKTSPVTYAQAMIRFEPVVENNP